MAAATLNDVTNSLMLLNDEQGNTTEAVKSLVKRVQDMLDFDKRKALDDAEATREARNQVRGQAQITGAPAPRTGSFGIGDALLAGAFLTVAALNEEISAIIDSAKDNLLKFVNDIQKIFFTINQGLIALSKFINTQIFSRIGNLILDIRTNPKITKSITVIEDSVKFVVKVVDETLKFISKTFKIISGAFTFIGSILRVPLALISNGVSEAVIAASKLDSVFKFFKGIGRIFGKLFLPLTIFITAWDTIKGAIEGFQKDGIIGGIEGAVDGFFNSLIGAPLDILKDATAWVLGKLGFANAQEVLNEFSFKELFSNLIGGIFDDVKKIGSFVGDLFKGEFSLEKSKEALGAIFSLSPVGMIMNLVEGIVPDIFEKIGNALNFFVEQLKIGSQEALLKIITMIQNIPDQLVAFLSDNLKIDIPRIAIPIPPPARFIFGGADEIVLFEGGQLGVPGGESARNRITRRNSQLDAQMLQLAGQNLSATQSVNSAPIIVAPSSTSSTSNVNQRFDLGMPSAADKAERLTVD